MEYLNSSNQYPELSIIIPSFNSENTIINCLDSIFAQNVHFAFEVIIIDSSKEDIRGALKSYLSYITYHHLDKRMYPGEARNMGATCAKGMILVFLDADCAVGKNWLKTIYHTFNTSDIKVVGGSINNGYPSNLIATAEYLMEFGEFMPEKRNGFVQMIPSCNLAIRKEVFHQMNGFSNFITGEDLLFSYILRKKNIPICFNTRVNVTHFNRRILKNFLTKQKELGIGSFIVRSTTKVKGYQLAKFKSLSISLPFLRILLIPYKVLKIKKRFILKLLPVFPFIILGILAYSFGFWSGYVSISKIDRS